MQSNEGLTELSPEQKTFLSEVLSENSGVILVFTPNVVSITSIIELKDLRKNYFKFKNLGWELLCITTGKNSEVGEYLEENSINFKLLHDDDNKISEIFGTRNGINMTYWNTQRKSIIIKGNHILFTFEQIKPSTHSESLLKWLHENNAYDTTPPSHPMKGKQAKSGE